MDCDSCEDSHLERELGDGHAFRFFSPECCRVVLPVCCGEAQRNGDN
jgi:hypothetical protein